MKSFLCIACGATLAILFGFHSVHVYAEAIPPVDGGIDWRLLMLYTAAGYGLVGGVLAFLVTLVAQRSRWLAVMLLVVMTSWAGWRAIDREFSLRTAVRLDAALRSGEPRRVEGAIRAAWTLDFPYHGQPALHLAAERGDYESTRMLLRAGANAEATNSREDSPLMIAVKHADLQVTRILLQAGARPDGRIGHGSPLDYARREGTPELLELLSAYHEGRRGDVQLMVKRLELAEALSKGDHEEMARLIEGGVNPNSPLPEARASLGHGEYPMVMRSAKKPSPDPVTSPEGQRRMDAFADAIRQGHFDAVRAFVEGDGDLSLVWWTGTRLESALTIALARKDHRLVSYLLPRMPVFLFDDLVLAAEQGLSEVVKVSVKAGIDPRCPASLGLVDSGCSVPLLAAERAHLDVMVALLESFDPKPSDRCEAIQALKCQRLECLPGMDDAGWRRLLREPGCAVGVGHVVGRSFAP